MTVASGLPVDAAYLEAMDEALAQASEAAVLGEIPVGAVILNSEGSIVARAHNECRIGSNDPTAHAEIVAIREVARGTDRGTLEGYTLVVTLEPCAMCAGAILAARIPTVVFGAWDEKAGAAGSVHDLLRDRRLPHRCEVIGGVREDASQELLRSFFSERRSV